MQIFTASLKEIEIIKHLAYSIWPDAYGKILSHEQLVYMLDKFYNEEALADQIIHKNHHFLLVKEEKEYLGFCSYEHNCLNSSTTKLHKLYISTSKKGQGIGKQLLERVEKEATQNGDLAVFLNVNRFNIAKDFYLKQGFNVIKEEVIEIGNNFIMDDFVMEKVL